MAFFVRWNWRKVVFLCIFLTIITNSTWISESYRSESSWANKSESHGFWSIKVSLSQPSDSSHGGGSICLKIRFCLATSGSLYLFIFDTCRTFVKDVNPNTFVKQDQVKRHESGVCSHFPNSTKAMVLYTYSMMLHLRERWGKHHFFFRAGLVRSMICNSASEAGSPAPEHFGTESPR